jgi:TPR repeat protein
MASLGFAYQTGQGVPQDWAVGLYWYAEAARLGDAQAQYRLGEIADHGERGVPVDLKEARAWYEKAAAQGHRQAAAALTRLGGPPAPPADAPLPTTPTPAVLAAGVAAYQARDYAEARRLLWPLADSGYAQAQYLMGHLSYYGLDGGKDPAGGVRRYRQAAEQGHALAAVMLGDAYESGEGVAEDRIQALVWFRRAADQGNAWGQYHVGAYYERGWGGLTADIRAARQWYGLAAAQGHDGARASLEALAYLKPPEPAATISTTAPELAAVGTAYNGGDYDRAFALLRPLAERGQAEAQTLLGDLYLHGRGVAGDAAAAVAWYRKASDRSYAPAMRALAKCYEVGLGVPRDMDAAERFYKRAAEQEIFHLGGEGAPQ